MAKKLPEKQKLSQDAINMYIKRSSLCELYVSQFEKENIRFFVT